MSSGKKIIKKLLKKARNQERNWTFCDKFRTMYPILRSILKNLSYTDLKSCSRVCRSWNIVATNLMREKILFSCYRKNFSQGERKFLLSSDGMKLIKRDFMQSIMIFQVHRLIIFQKILTDVNYHNEYYNKNTVKLNGYGSYSKYVISSSINPSRVLDKLPEEPKCTVIMFPSISGLKILPLLQSTDDWLHNNRKFNTKNILGFFNIPKKELKCLLLFAEPSLMIKILTSKLPRSYIIGVIQNSLPTNFKGIAFCGDRVCTCCYVVTKTNYNARYIKPKNINMSNCVGMIFINTSFYEWREKGYVVKEHLKKDFPKIHFSVFYENHNFKRYMIDNEVSYENYILCNRFVKIILLWIAE
ncbi:uncharacterized protein LOC111629484 [Centruroides sculpturatus]|uniref:uncharacterized protein LOC111629484 n=1 Tax=Centruroides sculpturatus TaxID=218467 RepID=UPI000C6D0966|nr:uncharacterized protein LOC111629484 [Centruroides sculpturatus]